MLQPLDTSLRACSGDLLGAGRAQSSCHPAPQSRSHGAPVAGVTEPGGCCLCSPQPSPGAGQVWEQSRPGACPGQELPLPCLDTEGALTRHVGPAATWALGQCWWASHTCLDTQLGPSSCFSSWGELKFGKEGLLGGSSEFLFCLSPTTRKVLCM